MKKYRDFTDYLMEKHAEQYTGTDDMMPDDFEQWKDELDVEDVIDYADKWGKTL